jgi:hypothetical protein
VRRVFFALLLLAASAETGPRAQFADHFLWTQLKYDGTWDPYPTAPGEVLRFMTQSTSIAPIPERRVVELLDASLFESPFVVLAGRSSASDLSDEAIRRLRSYLTSGGFLWIEDTSGQRSSPFDRWVRRQLRAAVPEAELKPISTEHALFRTFFLLNSVAGRTSLAPNLEGLSWGSRTVVVYSRNDLLGAWVKDALGAPLFPCVPGGEPQRMNAKKVTGNIIMYALTGTYKLDAVHQPFILQKLRGGQP